MDTYLHSRKSFALRTGVTIAGTRSERTHQSRNPLRIQDEKNAKTSIEIVSSSDVHRVDTYSQAIPTNLHQVFQR
jgi:hypothetical protein